jgi:hypothetical protein
MPPRALASKALRARRHVHKSSRKKQKRQFPSFGIISVEHALFLAEVQKRTIQTERN